MYHLLLVLKAPVPKISVPVFPQEVIELFIAELLYQWGPDGTISDPAERTDDSKTAHKALITLLLTSKIFYQTARRALFRKTTVYIYVDEPKQWNTEPRKLLKLLESNPSLVADIRHFQIIAKRFHPRSVVRVAGRGLSERSLPYLLEYIGSHGTIERMDIIGYHHHGQLFYEADQLFSWHKLPVRAQAGLQAIRSQPSLRTLVLCRFHRPSAAFLAGLDGEEDNLETLYLFESRFWKEETQTSSWRHRRSEHGDQVAASPLRKLRLLDASRDSFVMFANILGFDPRAEGTSTIPSLPSLSSVVVHHGLWTDTLSDELDPPLHPDPDSSQRASDAISCLQALTVSTVFPLEHISIQLSLLRQLSISQKSCLPRGLTSMHVAICIALPHKYPAALTDLHAALSTVIGLGLPMLETLHLTLYIRSAYHYPFSRRGWKTFKAADYISLPPIESMVDEETGTVWTQDNSELLQIGDAAWGHLDDIFSSWLPEANTAVPWTSAGSRNFVKKLRLEFLLGFCSCYEHPLPLSVVDEMEEAKLTVQASLPKTFGLSLQSPEPQQSQVTLDFGTVPTHPCRYNDYKRDRLYFSRTIGL